MIGAVILRAEDHNSVLAGDVHRSRSLVDQGAIDAGSCKPMAARRADASVVRFIERSS
jgi:hypothetical protein